ncbi:MAG: formate/nitrite transporter family protein [Negativicutes bacterium]|nr:formate/nitrite transporter family protein [Negativicutes bacterium]
MKKMNVLINAILAGFSISLGGTVFLRLKDTFPGSNVVGALLFTVGLFLVLTRGYSLYTGKVCYIFENKPGYLLDVLIIWVGNLLGCMLVAGLENLTSLSGATAGINVTAAAMVAGKLNSSLLSLFILGAFCNVFIFIGVNGYAKNPHELGKYLAVFLGVSIFIICGTEHSVADMYYMAVSKTLYTQPAEAFLRLFVITLGNLVGGVFLPLMEKLREKLAEEKKIAA